MLGHSLRVPLSSAGAAKHRACCSHKLRHSFAGARHVFAPLRTSRRLVVVRAENEQFGLAPAKPKTPYGEMLQYYLKMEPQLFHVAVEQQLLRLKEEKEAKEAAGRAAEPEGTDVNPAAPKRSSSDLVLYQRMEEVRASEVRATLEDLMYVSILEKFIMLGVEMLPRMDGFVEPGPANLLAMTEGIHSREALELIKEHLLGIMGPAASSRFSTQLLKMSKFQMAQVYAASVMFGYFLRRVDRRFQLEKSLGTLSTPEGRDDAVARLEALFAASEDIDEAEDPDSVPPSTSSRMSDSSMDEVDGPVVDVGAADPRPDQQPSSSWEVNSSSSSSSSGEVGDSSSSSGRGVWSDNTGRQSPGRPRRSALREYVDGFDQATMVETARIVSLEGAALVERQSHALFGDLRLLTLQMQQALGEDITSAEQLYSRMEEVVAGGKVETVTMTVATQRRCVLEAVAFGTFLRDVESHVNDEYGLLTPKAPPQLPPGMDATPF